MPRATPHLEAIVILVHIFWGCYILTCGASVVPFWCPVLGLKWLPSPALHPWALSLSRASEEQYHGNLKEACERGASLTAEGVKRTSVLVYACGSLCSVTPMTDIAFFPYFWFKWNAVFLVLTRQCLERRKRVVVSPTSPFTHTQGGSPMAKVATPHRLNCWFFLPMIFPSRHWLCSSG